MDIFEADKKALGVFDYSSIRQEFFVGKIGAKSARERALYILHD
jgi:hypothetical protein